MDLAVLPGLLSICRLPAGAAWPAVPAGARFHAVLATPGEVTVVCAEGSAPSGARIEPGWRAIGVIGPLDFGLVGILAEIAGTLAAVQVSIFVLSTFDTDYVLVRSAVLDRAIEALRSAGHVVTEREPELEREPEI